MKRKVSLKIKLLTVIIGLIIVSNVVQGIIVHNIANGALEDSVTKSISLVTENAALDISVRNSAELNFARNLAKLPMINEDKLTTEEKCQQLVAIAKESNGKYINIAYYGKDGYSYIPEKPGEPVYFGDRGYIKAPLNGQEYIRDPFMNTITNQLIMCYSVPVYKDNEVVGAICCVRDGNFITAKGAGVAVDFAAAVFPGMS